jgi:hypothetical protein
MKSQLHGKEVLANTVVVFDLFGNSSFKWEEEDDRTAVSIREQGGYHMPGSVTVCTDETFRKLMSIVSPILGDMTDLEKVLDPPLLLVTFGGCCQDRSQCTSMSDNNHAGDMLGKVDHLESILGTELSEAGVTKHWVLSGWKDLKGPSHQIRNA